MYVELDIAEEQENLWLGLVSVRILISPDPRTHAQPPIECNAAMPPGHGRDVTRLAMVGCPRSKSMMADVCGWLHEMQKAVETVAAPYLVVLVRDSTWNRVGGRNPRVVGSIQVIVK